MSRGFTQCTGRIQSEVIQECHGDGRAAPSDGFYQTAAQALQPIYIFIIATSSSSNLILIYVCIPHPHQCKDGRFWPLCSRTLQRKKSSLSCYQNIENHSLPAEDTSCARFMLFFFLFGFPPLITSQSWPNYWQSQPILRSTFSPAEDTSCT